MSRRINDLRPDFMGLASQLQERMAEKSIPLLIYSTLRRFDVQARLFRQGRPYVTIRTRADELADKWGRPDLADILMSVGPQYGPVRTNAAPGQSLHNYGVALDAAPMRNGEIVWGTQDPNDMALWEAYGNAVRDLGMEWGGDWRGGLVDMPHAQMAGVRWQDLIS